MHTFPVQLPEEQISYQSDPSACENTFVEAPGALPKFNAINTPAAVNWSHDAHGRAIIVNTLVIDDAYNEIAKWRKNTFLVPYGKTGREFIDKFTEHINDWNNGSEKQHIALKAAFVLLAVGLQKPSQKSKAKDHQECLARRLRMWNEGEIESLVREGRMIQKRLKSPRKRDPPNKAKIFSNLVMAGQVNSALRYLSEDEGGGILPLNDDVMTQLREKHPAPHEARLGNLLFGPM